MIETSAGPGCRRERVGMAFEGVVMVLCAAAEGTGMLSGCAQARRVVSAVVCACVQG